MASAYSERPSPSQSHKGSFTNLAASGAPVSKGNKENAGVGKRSKKNVENKYLEKQNHLLLGDPDCDL